MLIRPKDFSEADIELKDVFLDPNNPRFSNHGQGPIPEEKITDGIIQEKCLTKMREYGIDDLKESIRRVGFVQIDKVVVRELKKTSGTKQFVVVEGNRRIAALKSLAKELETGIEVEEEIKKTILKFKVIAYAGKQKDISWIIQGIRHISGIRNWPLYQQAEVLVKLSQENKMGIREASNIVGIGPKVAARLVRAWHGFLQIKDDEEYGQYVSSDHFSYFADVIFAKPVLQQWLGWDEKKQLFTNIMNLEKILSWIIPEEGKDARVSRAMDLRDVIVPAMSNHPELFKRFENDESMTVAKLNLEMGKHVATEVEDWLEKINEFNRDLKELPIVKIEPKKNEFKKILKETLKTVQKHLEILANL
jgi:hypothetical protein